MSTVPLPPNAPNDRQSRLISFAGYRCLTVVTYDGRYRKPAIRQTFVTLLVLSMLTEIFCLSRCSWRCSHETPVSCNNSEQSFRR